jgi:hypothetical protein
MIGREFDGIFIAERRLLAGNRWLIQSLARIVNIEIAFSHRRLTGARQLIRLCKYQSA